MSAFLRDTALFSRVLSGVVQPIVRISAMVSRLRRARQARGFTRHLLTHDDRLLSDIGVSRGDVEQALSVSWDQDPAKALAQIRRQRIQAVRQGRIQQRAL